MTGLAWSEAKGLLKQEDRCLEDHLKERGESDRDFNDRILDFYENFLFRHLVYPHNEIMNKMTNAHHSTNLLLSPLNEIPAEGDSGFFANILSSPISENSASNVETDELKINRKFSSIFSRNGSVVSPTLLSPLTIDSPSSLNSDSNSCSSSYHRSSTSSKSSVKHPKMKKQNILIITHGGWIKTFFDHLIKELHFDVNNSHFGFPKNTGIYKFKILKISEPDYSDYEWKGSIFKMNCVSHLANLFVEKIPYVLNAEGQMVPSRPKSAAKSEPPPPPIVTPPSAPSGRRTLGW